MKSIFLSILEIGDDSDGVECMRVKIKTIGSISFQIG
jgi:hypothetical protein